MATDARALLPLPRLNDPEIQGNPRIFSLSAAVGSLLAIAAMHFEPMLAKGVGVSLVPAVVMVVALLGGWRYAFISALVVSSTALLSDADPARIGLLAGLAVVGGEMLRRGFEPLLVMLSQCLPALLLQVDLLEALAPGDMLSPAASAAGASVNVALATAALICIPRRCAYLPIHTRIRWSHIAFVLVAGTASVTAVSVLAVGHVRTQGTWERGESTALGLCALILAALALSYLLAARFGSISRRLPALLRSSGSAGAGQNGRVRRGNLPLEVADVFVNLSRETNSLRREVGRQGKSLGVAQQEAYELRNELRKAQSALKARTEDATKALRLVEVARGRYRALMENGLDAVIFATHEGVIESANLPAAAWLGAEPQAVKGKPLGLLIPQDCVIEHPLDVTILSRTQQTTQFQESALRLADGKDRKVGLQVTPFSIHGKPHYLIQWREAGRTSGPPERTTPPPASTQRSRDFFIATMSHELRTPLHGLIATLDMMRVDAATQPELQQRLSIARISARSLLKIANDILDLTRFDSGHFTLERQLFGLDRLLDEIVGEFKARAEASGITVSARVVDALPPSFNGDPARLKQILGNLVSNAIKFTSRGGVQIDVSYDDRQVTIDVADTGEGIPEDKRIAIFDPFVQVESGRHGGAGLGLPISLRLAQAMGGNLILLRSGSFGSTFRLTLPLEASDDAPDDEQSQRIFTNPRGRILVVEDNAANRYVAEALLTSLECPATIVESGHEALEVLEKQEFDLILMDVQMPGIDGYETTERARRMLRTRIPIIAMTANAMEDDKKRCLESGMDDFLPKPFGRPALNDVLCKWLEPASSRRTGPTDLPKKLESLPDLDDAVFDELRESLQWQREPLKRICTTFVEATEKAIPLLDGSGGSDRRTLGRYLHTMVGSSGMVGARRVEHLAKVLQAAAGGGRHEEAAALCQPLRDALRRFQIDFERRLDEARR